MQVKNYTKYQMATKEKVQVLLLSIAICSVVGFLFYHSFWSVFLLPVVYLILEKRWKKDKLREIESKLMEHFINGLQVLDVSLQAGFSMENAWKEVEKETLLLYGEQSCFYQEINAMNRTASFNMPIELLFLTFAQRTGIEDIINFAEVMDYGKRAGSNWKRIISDTVLRMIERYETQKEIEVMVAGKRMEQQVMNVIPLGMLLFLKLTSWEYMSILYGNLLGVLMMSIFLVVYGVAILWSEKIMDIQV